MSNEKMPLRVVAIGSGQVGKSTVFGQMAYQCGGIDANTMAKLAEYARVSGKTSYKYAWVLDTLKTERERGLTMETKEYRLNTPKAVLTLIDVPGWRGFTPEMGKGVLQADAAVLVIDASPPGYRISSAEQGAIYEHIMVAFGMGVTELIVCLNKMDGASTPYAQSSYDAARIATKTMLGRVGFNVDRISFIPVSGWVGDNITSTSSNLAWYKGPTLLDALRLLVVPPSLLSRPLRVTQEAVYGRADCDVIEGRLTSGSLRVGDELTFALAGVTAQVLAISGTQWGDSKVVPGDRVSIYVARNTNASYMSNTADVCGSAADDPPREVSAFTAQVAFMDRLDVLAPGYTAELVFGDGVTHSFKLEAVLNTLGSIFGDAARQNPPFMNSGETGIVRMVPVGRACVDTYAKFPNRGRFYAKSNQLVVGTITGIAERGASDLPQQPALPIGKPVKH
ncbi:Elongation factor Tu GTP binding domain containing protein [Novymonas esmeraldas]|uniref:Elongation factor Tu GTP binding domain containing protein n=1 Tax=Novymonas esmeraldas TaxID=1808958 RepID=A0AAW0EXC7_9TRYP